MLPSLFEKQDIRDRKRKLLGPNEIWYPKLPENQSLKKQHRSKVESQLNSFLDCRLLPDDTAEAINAILNITTATDMDTKNIDTKDIPSFVQTLHRTNDQPTSTQRLVLQTHLANRNSELVDMENEILRHQLQINHSLATICKILEERVPKQQDADRCLSWLSAVRLLPPDILIRIFEYVDEVSPHSSMSILGLSQVCAAWRHAACMARNFWNTLSIDLDTTTSKRDDYVSSLMRLWYDKAAPSQTLSIHLRIGAELSLKMAQDVAQGLITFGSRMRYINLEFCTPPEDDQYMMFSLTLPLAPLLSLPGGHFSALETLHLVDHDDMNHVNLPSITVFNDCPLLRTLILKSYSESFFIDPYLQLPWHQLTYLEIRGEITLTALSAAFFQSRSLRTAIFHDVGIDRLPGELTRTTFPDLQVFKFRYEASGMSSANRFLSLLRLPNLHTLELYRGGEGPSQFQPFLTMLPIPPEIGSYPSLRRLSLGRYGLSLEQLSELLNMCPMLEELALCLPLPPVQVLQSLTRSDSRLFPSLLYLKTFWFGFTYPGTQHDLQFRSVAKSFGNLLSSWISDSQRVNALSAVNFVVSLDEHDHEPSTSLEDDAQLIIRQSLDRGGPSSPIKVETHVVWSFDEFSELLGMRDLTESD